MAVERGHGPLSIVITIGRRGDSAQIAPVLTKVQVARWSQGVRGPASARPATARPSGIHRTRGDRAVAMGAVRSEAAVSEGDPGPGFRG